ncbi:hypothetical protein BH18VER1_BH18VER1_07800 [soil metagenome]
MAGAKIAGILALDSNYIVAARKIGSEEGIRLERWLRDGWIAQVSAVAWSEYLCGPLAADDIAISRDLIMSVEPFTEEDAVLASAMFIQTRRRSRSHADCMIAAHAIRREAALATLNAQDFRRFEKFGLRLA